MTEQFAGSAEDKAELQGLGGDTATFHAWQHHQQLRCACTHPQHSQGMSACTFPSQLRMSSNAQAPQITDGVVHQHDDSQAHISTPSSASVHVWITGGWTSSAASPAWQAVSLWRCSCSWCRSCTAATTPLLPAPMLAPERCAYSVQAVASQRSLRVYIDHHS